MRYISICMLLLLGGCELLEPAVMLTSKVITAPFEDSFQKAEERRYWRGDYVCPSWKDLSKPIWHVWKVCEYNPEKKARLRAEYVFKNNRDEIEAKYEQLMTAKRKEYYLFECDKSAKQDRAKACQNLASQIQSLQDTKLKELDALDQEYRKAIVRKPEPQPSAATKERPRPQDAVPRKSDAEIESDWRERIDAVKREGAYKDCEMAVESPGTDPAAFTDCEERGARIERLQKEMGRELAS